LLICWVDLLGAIPIPVPNTLTSNQSLAAWLNYVSPDAIILSGGNDIGQFTSRDNTELHLLQYAEDKLLPVLGICRGMQFLTHYFNVGLKKVENHVGTRHKLVLNNYEYGDHEGYVNSYHNLSIESCPAGFEVSAMSHDFNIEAIVNYEKRWEGWMWHPERERNFLETDLNRAQKLLLEKR